MPKNQFYYKNNRFQQLKGFYYTVQKGGVARAAEHLGLSQSAVSMQISTLERDLEIKLFDRKKRTLTLTEDGRSFYKYAIDAVQNIDSIYERFLSDKKYKSKSLDISSNHISILYLLPKILKDFRDKYPEVNLMLRNIPRATALERLINNETELCIYPITNIPDECDFIPVSEFNPILLTRKDHPLATKQDFTLDDVAKYDLIRIDPHLITLPNFEQVIKSHKLGSNIKFENGDWEILKKLVKSDIGVAIISDICLDKNENELVGRKLTKYFPSMKYGIMIKKGSNLSYEATNFIKTVEKSQKLATNI